MSKLLCVVAAVGIAACYHEAPRIANPTADLEHRTDMRLGQLRAAHSDLDPILNDSYAFAVFPDVGEGQIGKGNRVANGVLFEHGVPTGFVHVAQPGTGDGLPSRINDTNYSELLVLRDPAQVELLKAGQLDLVNTPVGVIQPRRPVMAPDTAGSFALIAIPRGALPPLTVAGQRIIFEPRG